MKEGENQVASTFDEYRAEHPEASFIECALSSAPVVSARPLEPVATQLLERLEAQALEAENLLNQLDAGTAKTALRTFGFNSRISKLRGLMAERRRVIAELKVSFENARE